MPHIKLEHTKNIEPRRIKLLFKQLQIILIEITGVNKENCKCKANMIPVYAIGSDDHSKSFYHLEISLLKGRPKDIRKKIGKKSLQVLQEYLMKKNERDLSQFSVEIREMASENYFTSNTL